MIYLLLGEDLNAKDARIAQIKANLFKDPQSLHYDFENLDAQGLPTDALKKSFLTLPVIASKRLVMVHNLHKLKAADMDVLMAFLKEPLPHVDVILESPQTSLKSEFKGIDAYCTVAVYAPPAAGDVFDMTKLMGRGNLKEALLMLNGFFKEGMPPLQAMGVLVWFWGKNGKVLPKARFELGLKALEEADVNIKRSRLNPEYAVEKLVVELTELLGSGRR